ncbi:MAG: hypothetical protein ABIR29_02510 [Chthoniobacterales bacterium]
MLFAREYSESEDCILIGAILPVVARMLGRRVSIAFAGRKYPNLYSVLVTPPGFRKSTSINLVENIGRALLSYDAFLEGAASEQALFRLFQANTDRLLVEDEGNTLLSNWASDAAGKQVAKRFLRLYDCGPWTQTYMRQADENNGNASMRIDGTSTSLLVGTTYNNARFNGLETRDGMRRRVNYYLSERMARMIYWPADCDGAAFSKVVDGFRPLLDLEGTFQPLAGGTLNLWKELQEANRSQIQNIAGVDSASEAYGSALAEEGAKTLKFAMIFQICRWAFGSVKDWQVIQASTLQLATDHGRYCLHASQRLDLIGRRAEIREAADAILATVRCEQAMRAKDGVIEMTKSELTHRFAANPSRRGAMTPSRLYGEIMLDLSGRGLAKLVRQAGKLQVYQFRVEQ